MRHWLSIATFLIISLIGSGCRDGLVIQPPDRSPLQHGTVSHPDAKATALFPPETEVKLRQLLREEVSEEKLPGLVMYVSTSNGTWMDAEGKANLGSGVRIKPTDRFRIGGLTTLFVSIVCLQLAEDGLLNLDAPITDYLPQDVSSQLPDSQKIRVRRLLNQTSGLADVHTEEFWQAVRANPQRNWQPKEMLEYVYPLKPATIRGAYFYSDTNYLLLQIIIEEVTGKPLTKLIRDRITTPLKLTNTFMELQEPIPGGFTQGYQDWDNNSSIDNVTAPLVNGGLGLGDRGLVSNASDLVRFFRGLFVENRLLYPTSIDRMLESIPAGMGDGYGMGISHIVTRWGEAWGQKGQALGFQSVMLYFPVHDLMLVVWTNAGDREVVNPMDIAEEGLHIILGEPE